MVFISTPVLSARAGPGAMPGPPRLHDVVDLESAGSRAEEAERRAVLQPVLAVSTGEVVEVSDRQRDRSQI
jgi:hypothetical protein